LSASQTLAVTSTDPAPTLTITQNGTTVAPGSNQSFPHLSFPQSFTATAASTDSADTVTVSASVANYDQLFTLQQRYRFTMLQKFTSAGSTGLLLQAAGNNRNGYPIYLLRSTDGALFAYAGGSVADTYADANNLIATLGVNVYNDPTLLTGALPALDYTTLYNLEQQFHFQGMQYLTNGGVTAFILQASSNNAHGNPFYLLAPSGGVYAYAGGTYAATIADPTNLVATLDPQVYVTPTLLTGAQAAPGLYTQLQAVEAALDLKGLQYFINTGVPAYVLQAPTNNANGNTMYLLLSTGDLYAYGGGTYAATVANSANLVAHLDPSVYANPTLLTAAKAPLSTSVAGVPVTASTSGNTVTVTVPPGFTGTFQVTVTATDGITSTPETFLVTSTDTAPVLNAVAPQQVSLSVPLTLTLGAKDAENDPVTYSATAAGYSLPYNLQQQYHFQGLGYFTTPDGVTAYVLSIAGTNANGNQFYLLNSAGGLYAYDGGSTFGSTFAHSANLVAQLGSSVFTSPSLLTSAKAPVAPPSSVVKVTGNQLTINATGLSIGTVFEVFVTVSDGAETTTTGFLVTVTM
jgi:hypothetical protein